MLKPLPDPPSYKAYLTRRKYYWQARKRVKGAALQAEMSVLGCINNKLRGYDWVDRLGLPTVPHESYPDMEMALEMTDHDRFVVKPETGHSSAGVYLLTRRVQGGYDCSMTGRSYASDTELVRHFEHVRAAQWPNNKMSQKVIVEDLIEDSFGFDVPLDYKVYAFATGTPLVMQRYAPSRKPKDQWAFEFYNRQGDPVGSIRLNTAGNPDRLLRPPDCLEEIFAQARLMVATAQASFMRIDMYATLDGPVFGEFTPVPNNANEGFVPEYDIQLGQMWADSLNELGIDYTRPLMPLPASKKVSLKKVRKG